MRKITAKEIALIGVLVAVDIVLSRFCSIQTPIVKIGLTFVPIVIAGAMIGPIAGGLVGGVGDLIGALLFPIGTYFPGFTLTAFITGLVYGLFLKKDRSMKNVLFAVGIDQVACSLLLNTLWISILYGSNYWAMFVSRILQTVILIVVQIILIPIILKLIDKYGKRILQ